MLKNQILKQGDIIGKSGKLELGESIENALHFELIIKEPFLFLVLGSK